MLGRIVLIVTAGLVALLVGRLNHFSYVTIGCLALGITFYLLMTNAAPAEAADAPLAPQFEAIRVKYKLPALAGALFTTDGLVEEVAVGVRKQGDPTPVTTGDLWHLGSCTKAMTATLAGTFVAEGKLSWDAKVISFFPDIADKVPASMREVTLAQVLQHRAGLTPNLSLWSDLFLRGTLPEQRAEVVRDALTAPEWPPGDFHYANTGYVVVAAVLEKISGKSWEDLIRERLFEPLGMSSAGFGGIGTPGQIDQPWPHGASGAPAPGNGPTMDNPPYVNPAGRVHCTMQDWAKFLIDQLRGACGMKALLAPEIYQAIQTPPPGADFACGWVVVSRPWAGGTALMHTGSNTMNYCDCWLAPAKKFGVLVCTNMGGDTALKACDDAATILIKRHLAQVKAAAQP